MIPLSQLTEVRKSRNPSSSSSNATFIFILFVVFFFRRRKGREREQEKEAMMDKIISRPATTRMREGVVLNEPQPIMLQYNIHDTAPGEDGMTLVYSEYATGRSQSYNRIG